MPGIEVTTLTGAQMDAHFDDIARLRIAVFREWPYLYEGSLDYEKDYLAHYAACPDAVLVLARDGSKVVGASTGLPLSAADAAFRQPFDESGDEIASIYYFGESVLLPEFRGQGVGKAFFKHRETQARTVGAKWTAFCAIEREANDPRRPADYHDLHGFWHRLGYTNRPELKARLSWQEIGQPARSEHSLGFWLKPL